MIDYRPKTGDTNNRRNVFFSCHPDDMRFFDEIYEEIEAIERCNFFFETDYSQEPDLDDLFLKLSGMNLVVVPITTKLLTQKCRAMETEIPYAKEHNIPILPLMQENGLEKLFNKIFGNIHTLNKYKQDNLAIPYEEQLRKYINAVLVSDELAKEIKDEFDARIFLSYRKKDVKHAQELMNLIHSEPTFRDIAIWFDNFLTPGEDYNKNIKKELDNSDLFTLVVTPSLNELTPDGKKNYVMEHEYPDAHNAKKTILPAKMQETDINELKKHFDGIPEPIDANTEALHEYIESILRVKINYENENDPRHNYLIGMAYLNGVDVERNDEIALDLITKSANNHFVAAIKRLVDMYRNGIGVQRDYERAIKWQEELVKVGEEQYEANPTPYTCNRLFWDTLHSGDYYKELGRLPSALEWYKKAYDLTESYVSDHNSITKDNINNLNHNIAAACDRIGNIYKAQGNLPQALEYYKKSLEIDEQLVSETGTVQARSDLSVSYERIGNIYEAQSDLPQALEYYKKSLEIREPLVKETGTVESRRDLSVSYNKIGDIYKAQGKLPQALEYYKKSHEIFEQLVSGTGTVESRRDLSISYNKIGDIYVAQGNLPQALEYYKKSLEIAEQLVSEIGTVEYRRNMSVSYNKMGDIYEAQSDLPQALEYYKKSIEIREPLVSETGTVQARRDLSVSYERIGDIYKAQGNLPQALEYYKKKLKLDETLVSETGMVEDRRNLSISYNKIGDIYKAQGNLPQAMEYYKKSLEVREPLVSETGTVESRRDLSISYERIGDTYKAQGNLPQAIEYYKKSLEISEQLVSETDTVESRRDLSVSYIKIGDIYKAQGNLPQALEYYKKSLEIREPLVSETDTAESYDDLAVSYYKMAIMTTGDEQQRYLRLAYDIYCRLADACPDVQRYAKNRDIIKRYLRD